MAKFNSVPIKDIIDELNESFFVPDIQRNYVWLQNPRDKKIEQLFDSLMRGYPIGSFLFWKLKKDNIETDNSDSDNQPGKLNFQLYKFIENYDVQDIHNDKILLTQIKSETLHIVLDGQQRLTSLYIGLRGSRRLRRPYVRWNNPNQYDTRFLFLNLKHKPSDDNPDDCYQFEFKTTEQVANDASEAKWFRVSEIMSFHNDKDDIRDYCQRKEYSRDEEDIITDLYRAIAVQENISFFEETEKSLDKVLKIFIRVNSGGMALSYSDLLMSLLTATFKTEIRDNMERFVDQLKDDGFGCVGRDQILKTCLMLSNCNHVFKLENFSKSNIRKIESNWEDIVSYINYSIIVLSSLGYRWQLSSGYIASVIAFYLYNKKISKPSEKDRDAIAMFVRIAQLKSFFTSGLDGKLTRAMERIKESADFSEFLDRAYKDFDNFKVSANDIEWYVDNVKYGSSSVLPLLQLLYPTLNYGTTLFHIDHIYPKSKFTNKTAGLPHDFIGKENYLFNLQMLEGTVNEEKKAKDPKVWVESLFPDEGKKAQYFSSNYIPIQLSLEWSELPLFENGRKDLISKALKKAFGIPLEPKDKEGTIQEE